MTPRRTRSRTRRGASSEAEIGAILSGCSARVRALTDEVRRVVGRVVPTAYEVAYPGWKAIGFRDPQAGYFLGLFPKPAHIDLVFERGAELADPDGLFAPKRDLRQVRFVEIRTRAAARSAALSRMIGRALVAGSM